MSDKNKEPVEIYESVRPTIAPEEWVKTEAGEEFLINIFYQAEDEGRILSRFEIGTIMLQHGVSSTREYIDFFLGLLAGQGFIN